MQHRAEDQRRAQRPEQAAEHEHRQRLGIGELERDRGGKRRPHGDGPEGEQSEKDRAGPSSTPPSERGP